MSSSVPAQPIHYRVRQDQIDSHGSGADVRIIATGGELLRELRLDPEHLYFGLGGRWLVHNVLRQVSSMSS